MDTLDEEIDREAVFGTVEAVKTVSDLFAPVSGTIVSFNEELEATPELVNTDPYGAGWMVKIEISEASELDDLLDAETYDALIKG